MFVHGIFVAAWVWDEHVLGYLADRGLEVHALSLRGHGGSAGREGLRSAGLDDYTDDLGAVVARLGRPPVLIGHSMGGAVVQAHVARGGAAAGVALLASVPPHGLGPSALAMSLRDPVLYGQIAVATAFGPAAASFAVMRRALFSPDLPAATARRHLKRSGEESRRIGLELLAPLGRLGPASTARVPVLVMGGADDAFIPARELRATARAYGVEPVVLPDAGHALMLDPRWRAAADRLLAWLEGVEGSGNGRAS